MTTFKDPDLSFPDIRMLADADSVPGEALAAYGLAVRSVTPLHTGSYNIHFRVESDRGTFDLRQSNRPTSPENLVYEASLLTHLERKGFGLAPRIYLARDGRANVWPEGAGWTLFDGTAEEMVERARRGVVDFDLQRRHRQPETTGTARI